MTRAAWTERSIVWEVKNVVKKFAPHFSPSLIMLNFHRLNRPLGHLVRSKCSLLTSGGPSEHFNGVKNPSHGAISSRFLKRLRGTVASMCKALEIVQRPCSEVHETVAGATVYSHRKCVEGGGRHIVRGVVCL